MDAEKLIEKLIELQEKYGKNIRVNVNREEILLVVYEEAIKGEDSPEYINISS